MNKSVKELSDKELEELKKVFGSFERGEEKMTGVKYISGGYAYAEMFDYDDEYIDIELKWGVQSDCSDSTHVEQYKLSRAVLNDDKLTPSKKAGYIE